MDIYSSLALDLSLFAAALLAEDFKNDTNNYTAIAVKLSEKSQIEEALKYGVSSSKDFNSKVLNKFKNAKIEPTTCRKTEFLYDLVRSNLKALFYSTEARSLSLN
jgi:hypothetical protein